jgi:hypothetical protein
MANLHATVQAIAEKLASELVEAIRTMSLDELVSISASGSKAAPRARASTTAPAPARRGRPSKAAKAGRGKRVTEEDILSLLKKHKNGLRSEDLRKQLGTTKGPMRYHVLKLIADKKVRMKGTRNTAVYTAV